ncbi:response regulator transcription factor [Streptomyces sp. WAC05950]|uniref:LuxR C-terminal-related transcriptional regulator n=1 Tax=Streptomyces sp. WAC05950 TaxID=2487419 RepID=UPI000F739C31|nr:response regulator transcription factor [Streptomyces sp. WAC05950]RST03512.1 DNA-binding response regulator [Streptomyces sp. WAC05950]
MIRVAVVDDEPLIRSGIARALMAEDIEVVAEVTVADALARLQDDPPDVVLIDCSVADALEICDDWRAASNPRVCALADSAREDDVAFALAAGSAGYILKNTPPDRLPLLVRSLSGGWTVLSSTISQAVINRFQAEFISKAAGAPISSLSSRERSVLALLTCGLSNSEIGARLHLSLGTVKDHVRSILAKLSVPNRVQAAVLADRAGLRSPEVVDALALHSPASPPDHTHQGALHSQGR